MNTERPWYTENSTRRYTELYRWHSVLEGNIVAPWRSTIQSQPISFMFHVGWTKWWMRIKLPSGGTWIVWRFHACTRDPLITWSTRYRNVFGMKPPSPSTRKGAAVPRHDNRLQLSGKSQVHNEGLRSRNHRQSARRHGYQTCRHSRCGSSNANKPELQEAGKGLTWELSPPGCQAAIVKNRKRDLWENNFAVLLRSQFRSAYTAWNTASDTRLSSQKHDFGWRSKSDLHSIARQSKSNNYKNLPIILPILQAALLFFWLLESDSNRNPSIPQQRLVWQKLIADNGRRPMFRRHIRMSLRSFNKLFSYINRDWEQCLVYVCMWPYVVWLVGVTQKFWFLLASPSLVSTESFGRRLMSSIIARIWRYTSRYLQKTVPKMSDTEFRRCLRRLSNFNYYAFERRSG